MYELVSKMNDSVESFDSELYRRNHHKIEHLVSMTICSFKILSNTCHYAYKEVYGLNIMDIGKRRADLRDHSRSVLSIQYESLNQ